MLDMARDEAIRFGQIEIGTEHLVLAMLRDGQGVAAAALTSLGYDLDFLRLEIEKVIAVGPALRIDGPLPLSRRAKRSLELGVEEARQYGFNYIGTEHIILGILREGENQASAVLGRLNLTLERSRKAIYELVKPPLQGGETAARSKTPALDSFGRDLTRMARDGRLDPVIGRAAEIERLVHVFCRRRKNNPVLVGEAGVGKTAIVEGFVQAMVEGRLPEAVESRRVVMLDLAALVAGTKYRGEFEQRLKTVLQEVVENQVVIFVDELHTLIGVGGAEGAMDASHILKPALASGEIQCIGATTMNEYRKHIEKDAALERRFQAIFVSPPDTGQTMEILKGLRPRYAEHHRVEISDTALWAAVQLSDRYIAGRFQPDKAIDLLDEACASVRLRAVRLPDNLRRMEAQLKALTEKREKATRDLDYETAISLREQEKTERVGFDLLKKRWRLSISPTEGVVTEQDISEVVSRWTGVPVRQISEDEGARLLHMEEELQRQVIGQSEAVSAVCRAIRRSRTGIKDRRRPVGSFLFLGPTGVGKTLLARVLAGFLFDDQEALIQIDMSEYMERFSVSRLIGAPPGYVGYEEGGQLTERVRRRPYSVILFDEFEKAHPDVYNLLLQILEDGHLTDSFGRRVDFRNTILILTSNLGTGSLQETASVGFVSDGGQPADYEQTRQLLKNEAERVFRPEFLNRLDEMVVFRSLTDRDAAAIVRLEVDRVLVRLREQGLGISLSESAFRFLEREGFDPKLGARPLRRAITRHLEDRLSEEMLSGRLRTGGRVRVGMERSGRRLSFDIEHPAAETIGTAH